MSLTDDRGGGVSLWIPFAQLDAGANRSLNTKAEDPLDSYFACLKVAFASVRRTTPTTDLAFVSNRPVPERHAADFESLGVETRIVAFQHEPPPGFTPAFQGSLYYLDVLAALDPQRTTVLIDPDVVVVRDLRPLVSDLAGRLGAYPIDAPARHRFNNLSRTEAVDVFARIDGDRTLPMHYGGELYVLQGPRLTVVQERAQRAWEAALEDFAAGRSPRCQTEEHIMNYALMHQDVSPLDHHVKRIWTARSMRTTGPEDMYLTAWHLPAEKDGGFQRVAGAAVERDSWFWTEPEHGWRSRIATEMGLGRRAPQRVAVDLVAHARRHAREIGSDPFNRRRG